MAEALKLADAFLEDIGERLARIRSIEQEAQAEMEAVRARYAAKLNQERAWLDSLEKSLVELMKKEKKDIFVEGRDKVSLPHGVLFHGYEDRVRIPQNALEKVEALGWAEAVRVVKSLNRAVVAGWPIERLAAIGGEKRRVEVFKYEVRNHHG